MHGQNYKSGHATWSSSSAFHISRDSMTAGEVRIWHGPTSPLATMLPGLPSAYVRCQSYTSDIYALWQGFRHTSLPIARYLYCLSSRPGLCDVIAWTSAGIAQSVHLNADRDGFKLQNSSSYHFLVKAETNQGQSAEASAHFVVDTPVPSLIVRFVDGSGLPITAQSSLRELSVAWSLPNSTEPCSILQYSVAIGTTPGSSNLVEFTPFEVSRQQRSFYALDLSAGSTYYASVTVKFEGSQFRTFKSDRLVIDVSPPSECDLAINAPFAGKGSGFIVFIGNTTIGICSHCHWCHCLLLMIAYVRITGSISGSFTCEDSESGVARFRFWLSIGQNFHSEMATLGANDRSFSFEVREPRLDVPYFIGAEAFNGAGSSRSLISEPIRFVDVAQIPASAALTLTLASTHVDYTVAATGQVVAAKFGSFEIVFKQGLSFPKSLLSIDVGLADTSPEDACRGTLGGGAMTLAESISQLPVLFHGIPLPTELIDSLTVFGCARLRFPNDISAVVTTSVILSSCDLAGVASCP